MADCAYHGALLWHCIELKKYYVLDALLLIFGLMLVLSTTVMSPVREDLVPQNASIQTGQVWKGGVYFSPLFAEAFASQYRVSIGR